METKQQPIDRHCGNCVFFKFENTDGDGICAKNYLKDTELAYPLCSDEACNDFISKEEQLRLFRVLFNLKQYSDYMHDYRELITGHKDKIFLQQSNALSFAIDYIKTFNKL